MARYTVDFAEIREYHITAEVEADNPEEAREKAMAIPRSPDIHKESLVKVFAADLRHPPRKADRIRQIGEDLDAEMAAIEADQSDDAPGKTDTLKQVAEESGHKVVDASTKEVPVEDLRGLPSFSEDKE